MRRRGNPVRTAMLKEEFDRLRRYGFTPAQATKIANFDAFCRAYIEAALWSSTDNADDSGGEPLDKNYSAEDIAPATLREMAKDCSLFQRAARKWNYLQTARDYEQAGHDFWLTRNEHGAGFWDGDWKEPAGSDLTKLSEKFGSYDLYVGDDGRIHGSPGMSRGLAAKLRREGKMRRDPKRRPARSRRR